MNRPLPEEWTRRWGAAFAEALPPAQDGLDEETARELVLQAEETAREQLRGYAVHLLLSEAKALERDRENRERADKARAAHAAKLEREGRTALKKLFGAKVAHEVDLHVNYDIVEVDGEWFFAVPQRLVEQVGSAMRRAGGNVELTGKTAIGYRLGTLKGDLDGDLTTVLTGEQAIDKAAELVRADLARRSELQAAERKREAEERAARMRADEQRRTYGTEVKVDE